MKKLTYLLKTAVVLVALINSNLGIAGNNIELLFLQQAKIGKLSPLTKKGFCYDLSFEGINQTILYFSNTPNKVAGKLSIAHFLKTFQNNQKIHPNGMLTAYFPGRDQTIDLVGTLKNAYFKNNVFHYTFCLFKPLYKMKTVKLERPNLFIDPIHRWPP